MQQFKTKEEYKSIIKVCKTHNQGNSILQNIQFNNHRLHYILRSIQYNVIYTSCSDATISAENYFSCLDVVNINTLGRDLLAGEKLPLMGLTFYIFPL